MKKTQLHLATILFFTTAIFSTAVAQNNDADTYPISSKDSLTADKTTKVLYNIISVNNTSNDTAHLSAKLTLPTGWTSVAGASGIIPITIPPHSIRNIPVNLIKQNDALATWQQVKFAIWDNTTSDTHRHIYNVRAEAFSSFKANATIQDITLSDRMEVIHLGVYLKNKGNVADNYVLHWQNSFFSIDERINIKIPPGKDTIFYYPLKMSTGEWNKLYKQVISLSVNSDNKSNAIFEYKLNKPQNTLKQHQSAYSNVPITVEGSAMSFGNNLVYSYGGQGRFNLGEHSLLVSYRSRQFGATQNIIQRNVFRAEYNYKNWRVQGGQMSISNDFIAAGYGFKVGYSIKGKSEYTITGVKHDPKMSIFQSDGLLATAKYNIGKFTVLQSAEYNHDIIQNIDGYVAKSNILLVNKQDLSIDVTAGAGLEETKNAPKGKQAAADIAAGYRINYIRPRWDLSSQVEYNGKDFPGFRKGMNQQQHTIRYKTGKSSIGVIYSINSIKRNYFKDTLYNTDVLTNNSIRYGIISGYSDTRHSVGLNFGIFKQVGRTLSYNLGNYYFTDLNYQWKISKNGESSLNLVSQNVYNDGAASLITSDMLQFTTRYFGFSGAYVRTPIMAYDASSNVPTVSYYSETFNGGPFVKFAFFNNTLRGMFKYAVFKTLKDNMTRSGIESNITYSTIRTGTFIQLSGYIPLKDDNTLMGLPLNQTRFATLSVSQSLKAPVFVKRKYYNLKVLVYYDENNNSKKDQGERSLKALDIGINDEILMTDENGVVRYENIEGGNYKLDLINAQSDDLVPSEGSLQSLVVNNNSTYEIPFKKGKMINGNIKITTDDRSFSKFSGNLIKIIATDTNGREYQTFTDENGNFTMYVPAGIYEVSLNKSAYTESDFKPVQVAYTVDLMNHENSFVVFEIRQKKRKVRYLNQ